MSCVEADGMLSRLLEDGLSSAERDALARAARVHAARCRFCSGSAELIELLASSPSERAATADPGSHYWDTFEDRVRARILESAVGGGGVVRGSRLRVAALAAAVFVAGLLGGAWLLGTGTSGSRRGPAEIVARSDRGGALAELPPELVQSVDRASSAELEDQLAALEGWGALGSGAALEESTHGAGDGEWIPDVERLDSGTQERLLEWLRRQENAAEGVQG